MITKEIENYLSQKNVQLDSAIGEQIECLRLEAIAGKNEVQANYYWCLRQIYKIQRGYLSSINALKEKKV